MKGKQKGAADTRGRLLLVAALTVCTATVFSLFPLGYSRFSWEAFGQPYDDGQVCTMNSECTSMFCVDGFCCNTACDGPEEACNLETRAGICTRTTPTPALSFGGQVVAVLALLFGAWFGWFSRRREN
jgi:hypothetical protein